MGHGLFDSGGVFDLSEVAEAVHGIGNELDPKLKGLDDLRKLVPVVQDLGRRHVGCGVKDKDYDTVAAAPIWTLGQGLKDVFTADVENAWVAVYTALADTMKAAAKDAA